jgi:hypothetical protein
VRVGVAHMTGRVCVAQATVFLGIPAVYLILEVIPRDPSSFFAYGVGASSASSIRFRAD